MYKYRVNYIVHSKENFMVTKMQALQFEILISGFTLICMLGENSGLIEDHFWNFSGLYDLYVG